MKEKASAYIFSGYTQLRHVLNAIEEAKLTLINHIVWHFQFGVYTTRKFVTSHYHVLFVVKNPRSYYFNKIEHYPEDVWNIKRPYFKGKIKNGTKLPEDVVHRCLDFSSKPGDLIFDPFMGNGTTAIVAKKMDRHYLGFESNLLMKAIIIQNLGSI
jgi:site-specific DNA-methyltransferase (adenine-specific)